ncbi:MAG: hypothetical protein AAFV90_05085 [Cyanobacteria bacterium J06634_5]
MERIQKTSIRVTVTLMLVLLSCLVVFHLLILSGTIPYNIVWGGRLESTSQMYWFEGVSITVNLAAIAIVFTPLTLISAALCYRMAVVS